MLNLTGPQTLTIFTVNSENLIPPTAKQSSFTAPQGYHCKDNDSLHLFLGGQEYIYVSQSTQTTQNINAGSEDPVVVLEKRVSRLENVLLKPLEAAFKEA